MTVETIGNEANISVSTFLIIGWILSLAIQNLIVEYMIRRGHAHSYSYSYVIGTETPSLLIYTVVL